MAGLVRLKYVYEFTAWFEVLSGHILVGPPKYRSLTIAHDGPIFRVAVAIDRARNEDRGEKALAYRERDDAFGRLAACEYTNDAERLRRGPAMRWIVGAKAAQGSGIGEPDGALRDTLPSSTLEPGSLLDDDPTLPVVALTGRVTAEQAIIG